MHLIEAVDSTDEELPRSRFVLCIDCNILGCFLTDRILRKQKLRCREITTAENTSPSRPPERCASRSPSGISPLLYSPAIQYSKALSCSSQMANRLILFSRIAFSTGVSGCMV